MDGKGSQDSQRTVSQRKQKRSTQKKIHDTPFPRQAILDVNLDNEKWKYVKNSKDDNKSWGDSLQMMDDGLVRIVSKNIGGLRIENGNSKEYDLKKWITEEDIDILGIQEMGMNWENCRKK